MNEGRRGVLVDHTVRFWYKKTLSLYWLKFAFEKSMQRDMIWRILTLDIRGNNKMLGSGKGQLILKENFEVFHLNQEWNENIFVFLPYLSKMGQIKKRMQIMMINVITN